MKTIVISSPTSKPNEHEILLSFFRDGLKNFHIRKPKFTEDEMREYISNIPQKYHKYCIIHSHHHLIKEFNLKGIHQSSQYKRIKFLDYFQLLYYKFKNPNIHVSTTVHSLSHLKRVSRMYDYVFLSPVFKSLSNKYYRRAFDWTNIEKTLIKIDTEVIALGGVDKAKISESKNLGFKGVAFMTALWKKEDPTDYFKELSQETNRVLVS